MPDINLIKNPEPKETPIDDATLVNLVDRVPKEKQKELGIEVTTQYDIDIESRSDWEDKRDRWYKLWSCYRAPKTTPWPGASNVCIPMLATATNQFHARSYQSIFAPPGMVKTIPVSENDVKRAKNVEDYMNWQTLYEMEEYEEVFDKLLLLLPINGTAFKKTYYSKQLLRAVSEYISALDLVVPFRTKSLETARRISHRVWLHYDELRERNEDGLYSKSNFQKINEIASQHKGGGLIDTVDEITGEDRVRASEDPHLIIECHKNYNLGDGRKPYIFTVDYDSKTPLRIVSREYKERSENKILNYFTDYHFIPNTEGFYSFGFGHFLEPLNEMANTAFNQIFDSGRLTNQPFGFYGRRAGIKKKKISLHPGIMTEVEDAKQIYFPNMQRVDMVLFQVLGLIQQYTEQFTSTSDYLTGREAKGTKTPTAHGTLAIIEQGLVTFAVMTKRIFRSLRKELRTLMTLNQIFLPDSKEYRVVGSEDKIAFPDIKVDDFKGVYDVIPIGDPSYASKASRRQEAMEKYQVLMSNPLIIGNPDAKIPPNVPIIHAALSDILDSYDTKNKSKLLPKLPEPPIEPEVENAMFMQGDKVIPRRGEDHQAHLQSHVRFMSTVFFMGMPEEYKDLVEEHISKTKQVLYLDSSAREQLGGIPGAPPTAKGVSTNG